MDLILQPRDGFLLATAVGEQSVDEALQICRDMLDSAARLGVRKILFDCLALKGDLSAEERFELGRSIAEFCQQRFRVPAIALIGKPPCVTGYAARVAANRGVTMETFSDRERGLDWLRSRP